MRVWAINLSCFSPSNYLYKGEKKGEKLVEYTNEMGKNFFQKAYTTFYLKRKLYTIFFLLFERPEYLDAFLHRKLVSFLINGSPVYMVFPVYKREH